MCYVIQRNSDDVKPGDYGVEYTMNSLTEHRNLALAGNVWKCAMQDSRQEYGKSWKRHINR